MARAVNRGSALVPLAVFFLLYAAVFGGIGGIAGSREGEFRRASALVTVSVLTAGAPADRTSYQELTVRTPASAPGGPRTYERTLDLRNHDEASPPRPVQPGEQLQAHVRRDDPEELRLRHDAADSAGFFRFQGFFGLAVAAGCLLLAGLFRGARALRRRVRS